MNRGGMTALVDAMVFMLVMMAVLSLTVHHLDPGDRGYSDAGNILDSVCGVEVRTSDLTELDDDTLIYLTDLMAHHVSVGNPEVEGYLEDLLEKRCAGRPFSLEMGYGGHHKTVGSGRGDVLTSSHKEVPVSVGGILELELRVFS